MSLHLPTAASPSAIQTPPTGGLTISSLEIAGLTGKRHDNVLRDIRKMLTELNALSSEGVTNQLKSEPVGYASTYLDAKGQVRECFNLPKHETMVLVTGYSVPLRDQVLRRLEQLEALIAGATPSTAGLVTDLAAEVRSAIGGITKSVIHKELTEVIPTMVQAELAGQRHKLVIGGLTVGEILDQVGVASKGRRALVNLVAARLRRFSEAHGFPPTRMTTGRSTVLVYSADAVLLWLAAEGRALIQARRSDRAPSSPDLFSGARQ